MSDQLSPKSFPTPAQNQTPSTSATKIDNKRPGVGRVSPVRFRWGTRIKTDNLGTAEVNRGDGANVNGRSSLIHKQYPKGVIRVFFFSLFFNTYTSDHQLAARVRHTARIGTIA